MGFSSYRKCEVEGTEDNGGTPGRRIGSIGRSGEVRQPGGFHRQRNGRHEETRTPDLRRVRIEVSEHKLVGNPPTGRGTVVRWVPYSPAYRSTLLSTTGTVDAGREGPLEGSEPSGAGPISGASAAFSAGLGMLPGLAERCSSM
jgi:hypothetical protein